MKRTIFCSLLVLLAIATVSRADIWSLCGDPSSDIFQVSNVVIKPDPPVKGENITVSLQGTFSEEVTGGDVALVLEFSSIKILDETYPLCTIDPAITCPIAKGAFDKTVTSLIPDEAPSGPYTATTTITDQDGNEVLCVKLAFTL